MAFYYPLVAINGHLMLQVGFPNTCDSTPQCQQEIALLGADTGSIACAAQMWCIPNTRVAVQKTSYEACDGISRGI